MANILVIEDEPILARNICDSIALAGHEAAYVATGEEGVAAVAADRPDLILVDYRLPGIDGIEVLRRVAREGSCAPAVIITAHGSVDTAVAAMKVGASDFLVKPLDLQELQLVIDRVLKNRSLTAKLDYFRQRERAESDAGHIIGNCQAMREVNATIERITSSPALATLRPPSVLITGETGTGKDLVARAIHYTGPRRGAQLVRVNCTALPDNLAESELFGHIKGAFTDARCDKRGLFEVAEQGTLFLDEIGHMPPGLHSYLLIVLDLHTIRPVGSTRETKVSVHVIAATNRNLDAAIEAGEFREDLYHRLRVLHIAMPPLRGRGEDIETLARHFLEISAKRFGLSVREFSGEALAAIRAFHWPGNVRELRHIVESAVLVGDGPVVEADQLNIQPARVKTTDSVDIIAGNKVIQMDFSSASPKLDEIEYQIISAALEYSKNNLSRAARILGISRDAIRYRLDRYKKDDEVT